ncbi:MAG: FAD-binding oxidoreductase [Pseudomonadota bacterium]
MRVKRLPKDPGPAGWDKLLPRRDPTAPLSEEIDTDWLVIGAGFAGLAAAQRLSQLNPTDRVTILEAVQVASGPAGRNSGFMIDLPHDLTSNDYGGDADRDRAQIRANRHAIAYAHEIAEAAGLGVESFDPCGKVNGAATEKGQAHNASYAAHLASLGEPCETLNATDMRAMTGSDYYRGGLFTPGTVVIQPAAFIQGWAASLVSNRVTLYESSPVTALEPDAGGWRAQTPAGAVRAAKVILAVNGHIASFGVRARALMHVFTYASMTRALTGTEVARLGGQARWGITPADPMGSTVRRVSGPGGARIVIRSRFTYEPSLEVSDAALARVVRTHDAGFAARFPMLRGVEMEHRWGGRLCLTRNGVGLVEEARPGLWTACVQNGLGTVRGILSGLAAAEAASGRVSEITRQVMAEPAPVRLPPEPIATLGARAVLRWNEWRAGREL